MRELIALQRVPIISIPQWNAAPEATSYRYTCTCYNAARPDAGKISYPFWKKSVYLLSGWRNYFPSAVQEGHKMQEKYTYGLWGAAAGALALATLGFTWGDWHTASGVKRVSEAAVMTALIPACVKEVMADPTASAELKVKRTTDYDDVVRDYRKREIGLADLGYQFNRQCGRAIEALMAKSATKS
jgi:hypothetical protein